MLESRPSHKELCELVMPHYAAKWKFIGSLLDLKPSLLDIIDHDHGRSTIDSCLEMWNQWLNTDTSATWRKVLKVLEHTAVPEAEKSNLTHVYMYLHIIIIIIIISSYVL